MATMKLLLLTGATKVLQIAAVLLSIHALAAGAEIRLSSPDGNVVLSFELKTIGEAVWLIPVLKTDLKHL
jgi:hypothetical protein